MSEMTLKEFATLGGSKTSDRKKRSSAANLAKAREKLAQLRLLKAPSPPNTPDPAMTDKQG